MSTESTAARLLLMSPDDNCLVARTPLPADRVLRHGAPIGTATAPLAIGAHIHTHKLKSGYIPTYTPEDLGHPAFILAYRQFEPIGPGCFPLKAA